MKTKIILFVSCFALISSLLSVSCFAYVPSVEVGSSYQFSSSPSLTFGDNYVAFDVSAEVVFLIDGVEYQNIVVEDNSIYIGSYYDPFYTYDGSYWYFSPSRTSEMALTSAPVFTVEYISERIDSYFLNWLSNNVELVSPQRDTYFYSIYSVLGDYIFGGVNLLTAEQSLTLTLISTLLSIAVVLLPVLLVIGFLLRAFRL